MDLVVKHIDESGFIVERAFDIGSIDEAVAWGGSMLGSYPNSIVEIVEFSGLLYTDTPVIIV